jgi:ubiquinone/menaquinone biosynthesis C-methylase UbiE
MLKWFRKGLPPYHAAMAMVGVRSGNQVVVVGAADADLPAQIAVVTGLNGRTLVVDRGEARVRVEAAARRAGALVDFEEAPPTSLPVAAESTDVLVLAWGLASLSADERARTVEEAMRVLRPGGRAIVVEGGKASRAATPPGVSPVTADAILALLAGVGGKAVRTLATVDGLTYYEARKARAANRV